MLLVNKPYLGKASRLSMDGATAASGTWTTVYQWIVGAGLGDDNGWNTYTFVHTIPLADFSATGGTRVRLTFTGATAEGFVANAMYIGNGGGGDAYDFGDTPVQILMSGGGTITVGAGATGVVTDDVAFVKDGTNPFVLSMQFSDSAHDNLKRTPTGNDETSYYKQSVSEAATQNKTAYSTNLTSGYIEKIELLI